MANTNHSEGQHGVDDVRGPLAPGRASVQSALEVGLEGGGGAAVVSEPVTGEEARPHPVTPPVVLPKKSEVAPAARAEEKTEEEEDEPRSPPPRKQSGRGPHKNNVRKLRLERMMSKAELARRANLSVLTIDRVEKGFGCRMDSKRKILEALGLSLADRIRVFGEEE